MYEPSDDAKNFCSLTNCMKALTKLAPFTFSASSFSRSSRSSFGCSGMSNGFFFVGVSQLASGYFSTGARVTGSAFTLRFARAIATACPATRLISSLVTVLLLAKPQVPSTITRSPNP